MARGRTSDSPVLGWAAIDSRKVKRCRVCGAKAYWSTESICVTCTLRAEALEGEKA